MQDQITNSNENQTNDQIPLPNLDEVEQFLKEYGFSQIRRSKNPDGQEYLMTIAMINETQAILVTYTISGEFVMVASYNALTHVPKEYAIDFLRFNDEIKLAKTFISMDGDTSNQIIIDIGFELWAESWEKFTFFAFMDMLNLGIKKALEYAEKNQIPHQTQWIKLETPPQNPVQST